MKWYLVVIGALCGLLASFIVDGMEQRALATSQSARIATLERQYTVCAWPKETASEKKERESRAPHQRHKSVHSGNGR